jgi:transposase-like protein
MSVSTNPNHLALARERNHRNAANPDATYCRFLCPVCKQSKQTAGRESRGWKRGFRCVDCKEARNARIAAKSANP